VKNRHKKTRPYKKGRDYSRYHPNSGNLSFTKIPALSQHTIIRDPKVTEDKPAKFTRSSILLLRDDFKKGLKHRLSAYVDSLQIK